MMTMIWHTFTYQESWLEHLRLSAALVLQSFSPLPTSSQRHLKQVEQAQQQIKMIMMLRSLKCCLRLVAYGYLEAEHTISL